MASGFGLRGVRVFTVLALLASISLIRGQAQEQRPPDSTAVEDGQQVRDVADRDAEQDDPTRRLAWQRGAWGVVTPTFRASALRNGKDHSDKKNARGPKWVNIGPTESLYEQNGSFTGHESDSGRARTILPHPTNADIVYVLTSGGGLWRTNNWRAAEPTWKVLTDDLPTTGGGSVDFGRNPNTLYLGLGDFVDQILVGGAMTKSTNGGVSWGPVVELGTAVSVRDVKVDTSTNRDIVLVATDSGLYRSGDEGASYSAIATFAGMSVWSIVRTSAGWLASAQPCPAAFVGLQCGLATTLFISTDRGCIDPRDATHGTLYAATHLGVYRTVNGGLEWEPYSNGLPTVRVNDIYMPPDGSFTRIATYGRGIWELSQIELVNTALTDDGASCDRDGVLDNGESGNLTLTFANQGPNNLNQLELTVTSTNPHVSFPNGNTVRFPPLQKNGESTGQIRVALSGAVGVEAADFDFTIVAPELELPSGLSLTATHRVNYDEALSSSATESVESVDNGWTATGNLVALPNITSWQRRALSPIQHVWWGPDNNGQIDGIKPSTPDQQSLASPALQVGAGPLTIAFRHRFAFEIGGWDGGVIELSTDGGTTWTDVGAGV